MQAATKVSLDRFFVLRTVVTAVILLARVPLKGLASHVNCGSALMLCRVTLLVSEAYLLLTRMDYGCDLFVLRTVLRNATTSFSSKARDNCVCVVFSGRRCTRGSTRITGCKAIKFFTDALTCTILCALVNVGNLLLTAVTTGLITIFASLGVPGRAIRPEDRAHRGGGVPCPRLFRRGGV